MMNSDNHAESERHALIDDAYEALRGYSDHALAELATAELANDTADRAIGLLRRHGGHDPLETIDQAQHLVDYAHNVLSSSVLTARLRGQSWDAIGEAITGETGRRQTMINRYGHLENEWRESLLTPIAREDGLPGRRLVGDRLPDGLTTRPKSQERHLKDSLDHYTSGNHTDVNLPQATPTSRIADYTWRLTAAIDTYGASNIPPELAADLDTRKAEAMATDDSDTDSNDG